MSIINKKAKKAPAAITLADQLGEAATVLRVEEDSAAESAAAFIFAAQESKQRSATAAAHATAVEQALAILNNAGVVL